MGIKLKEVISYAKRRDYVNIIMLADRFDIEEDQACQVIKACWDRGLLLPTDQSYFTLPKEDGGIRSFQSKKKKGDNTKEKVLTFMQSRPDVGVSVNDVATALDITPPTARFALRALVAKEVLFEEIASSGGSFGQLPVIWGLSEDALAARDKIFAEATEHRKKKEKGKKAKASTKESVVGEVEPPQKSSIPVSTSNAKVRYEGRAMKVDFGDEP